MIANVAMEATNKLAKDRASQQVKAKDEGNSSSERIQNMLACQKHPRVKMIIDIGRTINLTNKNTFQKQCIHHQKHIRVLAESKHKFTVATIHVISGEVGCLVSSKTAQSYKVTFHLI